MIPQQNAFYLTALYLVSKTCNERYRFEGTVLSYLNSSSEVWMLHQQS